MVWKFIKIWRAVRLHFQSHVVCREKRFPYKNESSATYDVFNVRAAGGHRILKKGIRLCANLFHLIKICTAQGINVHRHRFFKLINHMSYSSIFAS